MLPTVADRGRRSRINLAWSPSGTKQISTLSGLSATPSPADRARLRTSSLQKLPIGNSRRGRMER